MQVLVTGANGFVGQAVCNELMRRGFAVTAAVRQIEDGIFSDSSSAFRLVQVGDLGAITDWNGVLDDVDAVIHLAARVHVMHESTAEALQAYRQVNVLGTESFSRAAAAAGVKRFVFLSSIKVNGESTTGLPWNEVSAAHPQDHYALSKWEAEQVLRRISAETGMEVTIMRPPLVYGPGVKANFLRLLRWVELGVPLPLASVSNQRSMIYLGNLVDALIACVEHPAAADKTYLVSDGEDVSTAELIRLIAKAMDRPDRLWSCPDTLLRALATLANKSAEADRLLGSLQIDSSKFRENLHWIPPYSVEQGIAETVRWFRGSGKRGATIYRPECNLY